MSSSVILIREFISSFEIDTIRPNLRIMNPFLLMLYSIAFESGSVKNVLPFDLDETSFNLDILKSISFGVSSFMSIDTLNKIVALPFPITQYMVNNYNKSSTISLDTYNRRKQLKRRELRSHGGGFDNVLELSLIHISEPTRQAEISYAVFCLKK